MLNVTVVADMEKRLLPFLKKGSKLKIVVDPFSTPRTAQVQIDLKEGLSPDMIDAIGNVALSLNFDSPMEAEIAQEETYSENAPRRPALPHVENEYDDVKDFMNDDLGKPVQTLFSMQKQGANRQPLPQKKAQSSQPKAFVVPDPEPIPEKKVSGDNAQLQMLMKQMQLMSQQLQAMQSGAQMPTEAKPEPEENFASIMTAQEFFEALDRAGDDLPDIDLSKKLTKDEAVELEKYKIEKPAYVVSSKGLLFIDDVGISVKQSLACNLSSIPTFKLKKSSDLMRCLKSGMLKFVNYVTAKSLAEKADLTSATEGIGGKLKTFLGENGSGVETAWSAPIDVTPGASDENSSESIMQRISSRNRTEGIIVDDYSESDVVNESDIDEQSDLINLTGGDMIRDEDASEALLASSRDRSKPVSKTWRPSTRLE